MKGLKNSFAKKKVELPEDKWELVNNKYWEDPDFFEIDVWETVDQLAELLLKKHKDYGPKNIAHSPGGPINGLRVRMWDKIARINNLVESGKTPENESLEDSFKDLANYSIIALMVLRGKWPNE